jgi:hypothetical protein
MSKRINIRYDLYDETGWVDSTEYVVWMELTETFRELKERFIQDWEPANEVHVVGYEETDEKDAPLYDEDVTIASVYKPRMKLVFCNIALFDDLK